MSDPEEKSKEEKNSKGIEVDQVDQDSEEEKNSKETDVVQVDPKAIESDKENVQEKAEKTAQEGSRAEEVKDKRKDSQLILLADILPETLTIIPLVNRPIFPGMTIPLILSGKEIKETIEAIENSEHKIAGAVLAKSIENDSLIESELYEYGVAIRVHKILPLEPYSYQIMIEALCRFRFLEKRTQKPLLQWQVEYCQETKEKANEEIKAYILSLISSVKELLGLNPLFKEQLKLVISHLSYDNPGKVMDLIASMTTAEPEKLQEILEAVDLVDRAEKLLLILKEEIELSKLQEKIKKSIEEKMSKQQKEFFLREQLKAIKNELGLEKDDKVTEVEKFEKKLETLEFTEEAKKIVEEELSKLKLLPIVSPEYHVVRNYLDWLTSLPWGVFSEDNMDIKEAERILNRDHYGLQDVKDRILEFMSTIIKNKKLSGTILCFVGPPGVGKTSIGRSIAEALGRKFYRFSVGGMRDESEIKGHRRTYIGAMPGKFIQSLKTVSVANPVIMLDEIDKIGTGGFRGDPASALLEVLDPEQNSDFLDHYLDVRFDLSNIMFITTANQLDTIPRALLDRMEVLKLSGYILEEKQEIAQRFLIPRSLERHGLKPEEVEIEEKALHFIIDRYAREAGVRNLENQLKKIMRRVTRKHAEGDTSKQKITRENIIEYLKQPIFPEEELYNKDVFGVSLGLAWTSMGGATLYIEAAAVPAKGGYKQTGQLGKVMEESSEIAYSYIRSKIKDWSIKKNFFDSNFIHLHVPAGATPKDGPSAGITMATALYSLAKQKPVRGNLAMTGELTLTGKVLPVGGIKEKIIAAKRVKVKEVILPKENEKDYTDLPKEVKEGIKCHFVDYFEDVLKIVYLENA